MSLVYFEIYKSGLECATIMTPSKHNTHYDPQSSIYHFVEALGSSGLHHQYRVTIINLSNLCSFQKLIVTSRVNPGFLLSGEPQAQKTPSFILFKYYLAGKPLKRFVEPAYCL